MVNLPFVDVSQICEGDDALLYKISEVLDGSSLGRSWSLGVVKCGGVRVERLGIGELFRNWSEDGGG